VVGGYTEARYFDGATIIDAHEKAHELVTI
jgi:hypothetical protein